MTFEFEQLMKKCDKLIAEYATLRRQVNSVRRQLKKRRNRK